MWSQYIYTYISVFRYTEREREIICIPKGSRSWSDCIWPNKVEDTLHRDLPAFLRVSIASRVRSNTTTKCIYIHIYIYIHHHHQHHHQGLLSKVIIKVFVQSYELLPSWNPANTWPPVKYSICFPACTKRQPSGTWTHRVSSMGYIISSGWISYHVCTVYFPDLHQEETWCLLSRIIG